LVSLQLDLPILKIGFVNPTPYTKILEFSKQVRDLLVVEEVQPFSRGRSQISSPTKLY
jgi:TPP-dependent indolepyruvate ferredoxin oxidoreductase alpha subunit